MKPTSHTPARSVSVDDHAEFLAGLLTQSDLDEIDAELDDHIEIDPYVTGTNNRRSDKELIRMLELIDSLPISSGKDGL